MTFMEAVKSCFTQYVGFNGRARRSEFWYFELFYVIVATVGNILAGVTGLSWITAIVSLAFMLPALGVMIRRMHDIGKSGWWILITIIPLVGTIIMIVWCCKDSEPGSNQYGPCPKA